MSTDWGFCTASLRQVSRTFSRPIEVLPGDLRKAVTCGYLLCRIVDTIEDNGTFGLRERDDRYAAFREVIGGTVSPAGFEARWRDVEGSPESEIELCSRVSSVMRVLGSVPRPSREAVLRWVMEMSRGMQIYSHRAPDRDGIIAPLTLEDLERYCYFVAGTVGHMLTELFSIEIGVDADDPVGQHLSEQAEAFGTGLQLVNILKDITDDLERSWSFVPRSLCRAQGLRSRDLTETERRPDAHRAVAPLFDLARTKLDRALDYALGIPASHKEIRLFCLLPLWLAVKTVEHAHGNDAMFTPGDAVKVSRAEVEETVVRCAQIYADDALLRSDYEDMWSTVSRLAGGSLTTGESPVDVDAA